jgi:flagellar hook-basal body complex protein FliE
MIIPPLGGIGGQLGGLTGQLGGLSGAVAGQAENLAGGAAVQGQGLASPVEGTQVSEGSAPSFGSSLSEAISSLEGSQQSASVAAQELAAGTVKDPEAAVTTVEDASLEMQLAAQIRTKATEAAQTIFQTQV